MKNIIYLIVICTSLLHAETINDPFEDINRITFEFNEALDNTIARPVAETYAKFPLPVKKGVTNFFDNLDGGASGTVAITAITLTYLAIIGDQYFIAALSIVIAGSTLGFLITET